MNHLISSVSNFFKGLQLQRVLFVALAGVVLLVSTACSSAPQGSNRGTSDVGKGSYSEQHGQQTNVYDRIQKPKGGMNNYNDDLKASNPDVQARAKALVDNSRRNLDKVNNVEEFAENYRQGTPVQDRVKNFAEDVKEHTDDLTQGVAKGTDRGTRNLKSNLEKAPDAAKGVAEQAKENAKNAPNGLKAGAKMTGDRSEDMFKRGNDTAKSYAPNDRA